MTHKHIIGVIGGGKCTPEMAQLAEEVGREIALGGAILICGGLSGVMEAACRGAKTANGATIGVLPGLRKSDANDYVDIPIVTGMSEARNIIIVRSADAVIAVGGEYGTLSEISFCLKLRVPVVGLKTWEVDPAVLKAETAEEAVRRVFNKIADG